MAQDIMVRCPNCQEILEGKDYQKHMLSNHKDEIMKTWLKCQNCAKICPNSFKLDIHKLCAHTGVILKNSKLFH